MKSAPVFFSGRVHIMSTMCSTCIFRPGNKMRLNPGRLAQMVSEATSDDAGSITCHTTLNGSQEAVCRGFFDHHATAALQIAHRLGYVKFIGNHPETRE